jgi:hypothetical protein
VSRVVGFSSNPNLVFRKVRCEPLSFWGLILICSSCVPWCPCANILSEEVWDVSRGVRVSSNPKFRVFFRKSASLFHYFWVWILTVLFGRVPWCPCAEYFSLRRSESGLGFSSNPKFRFS